jgi:nitrite reductase/ring-hydroxylating ferredoxin subunit
MTTHQPRWQQAVRLDEIEPEGSRVVQIEDQTIALFRHEGTLYAIDNRCPHMGFPLHQGSIQCGVLTCHWHHARFDLVSGGTFDPWADDVRAYPVRVEEGMVWVDVALPATPPTERYRARLADGMRQNLRLLLAKSLIGLHAAAAPTAVALEVGADYGTRLTRNGWGSGLTILTAMANILPSLSPEDRPRALYQGLTHVAAQIAGQAPDVPLPPLPGADRDPAVLKKWLRDFLEVRNADGAERTLATAIAAGLPMPVIADMLFTAATDHLYINGGHTLDFINKAFELLDLVGWQHAGQVLPSLIPNLASASRSEEMSSWRHPIDLAQLLWDAYAELPELAAQGHATAGPWQGRTALVENLLLDDPAAVVCALKTALAAGATCEQLAGAVAHAAARRIAQFRTSNEFGDWITVLHTFTYANAVHQAMRRAPSLDLLRGVFDAAVSVYLDRFLNMPPAPLPPRNTVDAPDPTKLLDLMNTQQQVNEAARLVSDCLTGKGDESALLATLGQALLREDGEFHSFQMVEAGFRQYADLRGTEEGRVVLIAVARYLAAHAPTSRASGQTYQTALRLQRGEALYTE